MEDDPADSSDFAGVRGIQQGPQAPGIQLRRPDGRLCVHAGGWNGERSRRRLFPVSGDPAGLNYEDVDLSEQTPTLDVRMVEVEAAGIEFRSVRAGNGRHWTAVVSTIPPAVPPIWANELQRATRRSSR